MFTNGYELTTALTNIIICFISLYSFFKSKKKLILWNIFFIVISIASFMGFVYHGINLNGVFKEYLWKTLTFGFCIGINSLLVIAYNELKKISNKKSIWSIFIMSLVLFIIFIVFELFNIDSFNIYKVYCGISMIGILVFYIVLIIKNNKSKYFYYYIFALFINLIGGLFLINDSFKIIGLDKNGIYHLFLVITIYLFYRGNKLR